jgi:hypothetical protein
MITRASCKVFIMGNAFHPYERNSLDPDGYSTLDGVKLVDSRRAVILLIQKYNAEKSIYLGLFRTPLRDKVREQGLEICNTSTP